MLKYIKNIFRVLMKIHDLRFLYRKNWFIEIHNNINTIKKQLDFITIIVTANTEITGILPAKDSKREIQKKSIILLDIVTELCVQHNLTYWLDFGTLLGSVRHKGFIPWDDDIDISMPRKDFNNIINLLNIKFYKNKQIIVREKLESNMQIRLIYTDYNAALDIFPVDEILLNNNFSKINLEKRIKQSYTIVNKLCKNKDISSNISLLRSKIYNIQSEFVLNNQKGSNIMLMYGIDYPHTHPECIFSKNIIYPLKKGMFEGKSYSIPNRSNDHLLSLYGDYMSYPRWI